jgi:ferrochelatase
MSVAGKTAIVLFNLGGPDSPEAVAPFLRNLFSDPAIIALPWFLRLPLAWTIARGRAPVARDIYAKIGGASPIVRETQVQARALEAALAQGGIAAKAFIAMRYWHPFSDGAARAVKAYNPDKIVLLPLYPQFSTTTTASSLKDWKRAARKAGLDTPVAEIHCYPEEPGFITAAAAKIRAALQDAPVGAGWRLLLSAHGLPQRIIDRGDPYQRQVEQTAAAIMRELAMPELDAIVCYQSRVGRLKWIEPATDAEIRRAGRDGKRVIVAPIAFVSEHSETLVELDIEYRHLAAQSGVPDYRRAATVGDDAAFIAGLAGLVKQALAGETAVCGAPEGDP